MPFIPTAAQIATVSDWTSVVKSLDESVSSNTSFQADDELFFAPTNNRFYEVELLLLYGSPAGAGTPDFLASFHEDGTARGIMASLGWSTTDAAALTSKGFSNLAGVALGTAAADRTVKFWGIYGPGTGSQAGLFWCQNSSSPNATIVRAGSLLRYKLLF